MTINQRGIDVGTDANVLTDAVTLDATAGDVGIVKIIDATTGGTNRLSVSAAGAAKVDGSAVTQPVSASSLPLPTGASTAANQTTIIGHVDGIETVLGTIDTDTGNIATNTTDLPNVIGTDGAAGPSKAISVAGTDGSGNLQELKTDTDGELQVDISSSALPTGAATSANQTTIIGHLDGVEGLLTTIDADTGTLAGAVAGTEMQVDIVAALPAGTNAIGKLAANSGVDIGDVDVTSLPALAAGTNLIGRISASNETSTIYNGTTALTPKFAAISAASSGNNTLVAAVSSKKIRVLALNMIASAATNMYMTDGAGGSAIWAGSTNKANFAANGGVVLPYSPVGWFETSATTALVLNLSAANAVGGSITYCEV